jgi:hypothetical protein
MCSITPVEYRRWRFPFTDPIRDQYGRILRDIVNLSTAADSDFLMPLFVRFLELVPKSALASPKFGGCITPFYIKSCHVLVQQSAGIDSEIIRIWEMLILHAKIDKLRYFSS